MVHHLHYRNKKMPQRKISRTTVVESVGPDGKIRGTLQQLMDRYTVLAQDALREGDLVIAEGFFQHADHYRRQGALCQPTGQSLLAQDRDQGRDEGHVNTSELSQSNGGGHQSSGHQNTHHHGGQNQRFSQRNNNNGGGSDHNGGSGHGGGHRQRSHVHSHGQRYQQFPHHQGEHTSESGGSHSNNYGNNHSNNQGNSPSSSAPFPETMGVLLPQEDYKRHNLGRSRAPTLETRPTPMAEIKTETRPEIKLESKVEIKPETRPEIKPETRPEIKPETRPEIKPETE